MLQMLLEKLQDKSKHIERVAAVELATLGLSAALSKRLGKEVILIDVVILVWQVTMTTTCLI